MYACACELWDSRSWLQSFAWCRPRLRERRHGHEASVNDTRVDDSLPYLRSGQISVARSRAVVSMPGLCTMTFLLWGYPCARKPRGSGSRLQHARVPEHRYHQYSTMSFAPMATSRLGLGLSTSLRQSLRSTRVFSTPSYTSGSIRSLTLTARHGSRHGGSGQQWTKYAGMSVFGLGIGSLFQRPVRCGELDRVHRNRHSRPLTDQFTPHHTTQRKHHPPAHTQPTRLLPLHPTTHHLNQL